MNRAPQLLAACSVAVLSLAAAFAAPVVVEASAPYPAPTLELATLDGHLIHAKDLAGKVVLLDFWATWCAPCRAALPELEAMTKRYDPAKFTLISVSADFTQPTLRLFLEQHPSPATQIWDGDSHLRKLYGVRGFPTYFVIDPKGQVVHQQLDWGPTSAAMLSKAIEAQLKKVGSAGPETSVARK
ncbi:MAG: TlpA disulfide reductase family protein [Acidobacteriota bacterium]